MFGILGGHPGWTEWYGWLKEGPWGNDFRQIVIRAAEEAAQQEAELAAKAEVKQRQGEARDREILDTY